MLRDFPPEIVIEIRDLFDLDRETLRRFDAVIYCFGVWDDSLAELHIKSVKHLCACLSGEKARTDDCRRSREPCTDSGHKRKFMKNLPSGGYESYIGGPGAFI